MRSSHHTNSVPDGAGGCPWFALSTHPTPPAPKSPHHSPAQPPTRLTFTGDQGEWQAHPLAHPLRCWCRGQDGGMEVGWGFLSSHTRWGRQREDRHSHHPSGLRQRREQRPLYHGGGEDGDVAPEPTNSLKVSCGTRPWQATRNSQSTSGWRHRTHLAGQIWKHSQRVRLTCKRLGSLLHTSTGACRPQVMVQSRSRWTFDPACKRACRKI